MWSLIVVMFINGSWIVEVDPKVYARTDDCYDAREAVVRKLGRPIVNYQAVCVRIDGDGL